jgi:hypothetical protein
MPTINLTPALQIPDAPHCRFVRVDPADYTEEQLAALTWHGPESAVVEQKFFPFPGGLSKYQENDFQPLRDLTQEQLDKLDGFPGDWFYNVSFTVAMCQRIDNDQQRRLDSIDSGVYFAADEVEAQVLYVRPNDQYEMRMPKPPVQWTYTSLDGMLNVPQLNEGSHGCTLVNNVLDIVDTDLFTSQSFVRQIDRKGDIPDDST